jgi:mxaJ protein
VWGPIAGYFQKKRGAASLVLVPLEDAHEAGIPSFGFDISMGVRKSDTELKARLEQVIDRKQDEIRAILQGFGVPLMPLATAAPSGAATTRDGQDGQRKGGS